MEEGEEGVAPPGFRLCGAGKPAVARNMGTVSRSSLVTGDVPRGGHGRALATDARVLIDRNGLEAVGDEGGDTGFNNTSLNNIGISNTCLDNTGLSNNTSIVSATHCDHYNIGLANANQLGAGWASIHYADHGADDDVHEEPLFARNNQLGPGRAIIHQADNGADDAMKEDPLSGQDRSNLTESTNIALG